MASIGLIRTYANLVYYGHLAIEEVPNNFVVEVQALIDTYAINPIPPENYVHPATHPPSIIVQDANNRFVTDAEKAIWTTGGSTAAVTTTTNGLMISTDKVKLDGLNNYTHPTNHSPSIITQDANNRFVTDAEKTLWNSPPSAQTVTTTTNGLMISTDKVKLDGLKAMTTGTANPTGGADGDIYFQYV